MTTSQMQFLSDMLDGLTIPDAGFVYFRGDLENQAHSLLLEAYSKRQKEGKFSQKEYAARIHRTPEVVNRHISVAGNWGLDTLADYFLGLRARLVLTVVYLEDLRKAPVVQVGAAGEMSNAASALNPGPARGIPPSPEPSTTQQSAPANVHQPVNIWSSSFAGLNNRLTPKNSSGIGGLNEGAMA